MLMTRKFLACFAAALMLALLGGLTAMAQGTAPLRLTGTIPLDGVEGQIDHIAATPDGELLFVAARGSNRVLRIDTHSGKVTGAIAGIKEPQGVAYLPKARKLVVAAGGDGEVRIYDAALKLAGAVGALKDADNVRYDPDSNLVYAGYGHGAIAIIDPDKIAKIATIPLDGHPESFQLEARGTRLFVNVPAADEIEVFDRANQRLLAEWKLKDAAANFPMALDAEHQRLFVGTRQPPRMLVIGTEDGKEVAILSVCGDTDDLSYDHANALIYMSGGEGCVDVLRQAATVDYERVATLKTMRGARTSLFVPAAHRLYVAVPPDLARKAQLLVFETQ